MMYSHSFFRVLLCTLSFLYVCDAKPITIVVNSTGQKVTSKKPRWNKKPTDPTVDAFEACGLIKYCSSRYTDPEIDKSCIAGRSCDMIFTYGKGLSEAPADDEAVFEIFAVAHGWVAVGISTDDVMGDDYVIECVKEGDMVNLYNSWNYLDKFGVKNNKRLHGEQSHIHNIRPVKILFYEAKMYCKFYIKKRFSKIDPMGNKHEYDLEKPYVYLMAYSGATVEKNGEETGNIGDHKTQGAVGEVGRGPVVSGVRLSPLPRQTKYIRVHGIHMIFAWMFFMSLSIFIGRYLKETLARIKICRVELWHFSHAFIATLALPCIVFSMFCQLQSAIGWHTLFRSNFHTYSGIVCLCLFITELISGVCAKKTAEGEKHSLISRFHGIVGHLTYALSLLNLGFAQRVAYGFLACNFQTYVIVWSVLYTIIHFLMTYHKCWGHFILGRGYLEGIQPHGHGEADLFHRNPLFLPHGRKSRRASRRLSRRTFGEVDAHRYMETLVIEAPGRYFRMWALLMFIIVTACYTFWATRKLLHFPKYCYEFKELKDLESGGFN